jgi:hypothetical protein
MAEQKAEGIGAEKFRFQTDEFVPPAAERIAPGAEDLAARGCGCGCGCSGGGGAGGGGGRAQVAAPT